MNWRQQAYLQHQQQRWLRPDATRWVRPDAAKFLKPGTRPADVYPALALKYNQDQPRVPVGNSDGGQWTSGSGGSGRPRVHIYRSNPDDETGDGGFDLSLPDVSFDLGDIAREIDKLDLFGIKPSVRPTGGVRLAGDPPHRLPAIIVTPDDPPRGIGHNGGPPLEDPPEIPKVRPKQSKERTAAWRSIGRWIGRILSVIAKGVGRALFRRARALLIAFDAVVNSIPWLRKYSPQIKTYRDPPRTMNELRENIGKPGYHRHHIAEEAAAREAGDPEFRIQGIDNLAGIPISKHYDITAEYNRKVEQPDGSMRSPRELLQNADFETRKRYGLEVLRRHGVLK